MKDPRIKKMANNLLNHSVELKKGENLLIEVFDAGFDLAEELIKIAQEKEANVFLNINPQHMQRALIMNASKEQLEMQGKFDKEKMKNMDAYIAIRGEMNASELSDIPPEKMDLYQKYYMTPVHMDTRIPSTKWCVMSYPTAGFAQKSKMSLESMEDFYFDVCSLNYEKMGIAMDALVSLMKRTDKVRLLSKGTDITFSIKGSNSVKCFGKRNIPDGEVYSAPVINSANGHISYNFPCDYMGFTFENVEFTFKDGKIIEATGNDPLRINKLLDTDDGARFLGEFAIGVNPYIKKSIAYTLFDEKMSGSFHLTPGNPYKTADNGNKSSIHWDLVSCQTTEYGGGEIWFDDVLIRKDGIFVIDELAMLNPENLMESKE